MLLKGCIERLTVLDPSAEITIDLMNGEKHLPTSVDLNVLSAVTPNGSNTTYGALCGFLDELHTTTSSLSLEARQSLPGLKIIILMGSTPPRPIHAMQTILEDSAEKLQEFGVDHTKIGIRFVVGRKDSQAWSYFKNLESGIIAASDVSLSIFTESIAPHWDKLLMLKLVRWSRQFCGIALSRTA